MSNTHNYSLLDLKEVLVFNYGLNKIGLHPFVGVNHPAVQTALRVPGSETSVKDLIESDTSLISTKARADSQTCTICLEPLKSNEEIVRHSGCELMSHYECLELWLTHDPACPCCKVNFKERDGSEERRALLLANRQLQRDVETATNPGAVLQPMIDRMRRMQGYMSTQELHEIHSAGMGVYGEQKEEQKVAEEAVESEEEMDFGEYSDNDGFDWDD